MSLAVVAETVGLAVLVAGTTACIDYAAARYNLALREHRRHRAARWSVGHWAVAAFGFAIAVKVSMWFILAEPVGLYLGTWLGAGADAEDDEDGQESMRETYDHVTAVKCLVCSRVVAGVRVSSTRELLVARHLRAVADVLGFCPGSFGHPEDRR